MSDKKTSATNGRGRTRNFACVVYPESAPVEWLDILKEQFVPGFVSPLHDADINPGGEEKKHHFHVLLTFEGVKTVDQAKAVFDKIGGIGCEVVQSVRGYARYLCHLDNPEKAQYSPDDVVCLSGADYVSVIGLASDKYKALTEMEEFCERYNVFSFYALSRYASIHRSDWSRILKDCGAVYMREYLNSRKWSLENGFGSIVDPESGEKIL